VAAAGARAREFDKFSVTHGHEVRADGTDGTDGTEVYDRR
jgi:hypothetical protein